MALIKCKECETEVSSKAETCPKCGARVAAKPMGCGTLIGVIFLGGIIISVFSGIFSSGTRNDTTSSPPSVAVQVGSDVVLTASSGDVVVCSSKDAYDQFLKLAVAEDYLGMGQMEAAGRLFRVPSGTKAKIIGTGFEVREVRIMEGKSFGQSGWVTASLTH